jgi:hypothetical protein
LGDANLSGANLSKVDFSKANLDKALSLQRANIYDAKGLNQLKIYLDKGAINEDPMMSSFQSTASLPSAWQSNDT